LLGSSSAAQNSKKIVLVGGTKEITLVLMKVVHRGKLFVWDSDSKFLRAGILCRDSAGLSKELTPEGVNWRSPGTMVALKPVETCSKSAG
jgi:hypothetical protein